MFERQGFRAGDITVVITDPVRGHRAEAPVTLLESHTTLDAVESYLRRRILVLFAGSLAESIGANGLLDLSYAIQELHSGGATDDFKGVRELLRVLRGIRCALPTSEEEHEQQLRTLQDELWDSAATLVLEDSELIRGLAMNIAGRFSTLNAKFGITSPELKSLPAVSQWLSQLAR